MVYNKGFWWKSTNNFLGAKLKTADAVSFLLVHGQIWLNNNYGK